MDIEYFHWKLEDILPLSLFKVGLAERGELGDHYQKFVETDEGWTFQIIHTRSGDVVFSCNHTHTCPEDCE